MCVRTPVVGTAMVGPAMRASSEGKDIAEDPQLVERVDIGSGAAYKAQTFGARPRCPGLGQVRNRNDRGTGVRQL